MALPSGESRRNLLHHRRNASSGTVRGALARAVRLLLDEHPGRTPADCTLRAGDAPWSRPPTIVKEEPMAITKARAFANGAVALICWNVDGKIDGCLEFEITRHYKD